MKKLVTVFLFVIIVSNVYSQTWKELISSGQGFSRSGAFNLGDSVYFIEGSGYSNAMWTYDTTHHDWTQVTSFPTNYTDGLVACSLNGLGYAGMGAWCCYYFTNAFYKYDPNDGLGGGWTQLASFPGHPRAYGLMFALDGKIYMGGGLMSFDNDSGVINYGTGITGTPYNDFWVYNTATNIWDSIKHCPAKGVNCDPVAFVIGDKAYVGTGGSITTYENGASTPQNDFWEYDTTSKVWTQVASIPGTRAEASAFSTCDRGYVGLGYTDYTRDYDDSDFYEYFPDKDRWIQIANYGGGPRNAALAFAIDKTGYVLSGSEGSGKPNATDFWSYTGTAIPAFSADTSTCQGGSITFTDTSLFAPDHWSWQFPGGTPDTSTSRSPTVVYDTAGPHNVIFTTWNSCDSGSKVFTNYITVRAATPLIIQSEPMPPICAGQSITLSVPVSGKDYTWTPASALDSDTGDTVVATPSLTTTYIVNGTDSSGCSVSGIDTVTVNHGPEKPTILQSGNVLTSSATQGNQWLRNDTVLTGATNQTYTITIFGYYQVIAKNPVNGCSTTSDSIYPTGINQLSIINNQLFIYPNPTSGEVSVNISLSVGEVKDWSLQITDVLGRTVYTKLSLSYNNDIDLSNLVSGMYFITVINKIARAVVPVVKQ